jgi:predicted transcriptional regulator
MNMRITIMRSSAPRKESINEEIKWFGETLGLFGLRDKDSSCYRVFVELLKSSRERKGLSSDEISYRIGLSRGTVIHHINRLMESGLVSSEGRMYILRVQNLEALVEELQKDLWRSLEDLKQIAKKIDGQLGI